MIYKSPEGIYPLFSGDVQLANPDWNIGDPMPKGWLQIEEIAPPDFDSYTEKLVWLEPIEINGVLTQQWGVEELSEEEKERLAAPKNAKQKLLDLGLTELEIYALIGRAI